MFTLKDEIELLEREITQRRDKLFIDEINLKNLKDVLLEKFKRQTRNEKSKISMEKSMIGMNTAILKLEDSKDL